MAVKARIYNPARYQNKHVQNVGRLSVSSARVYESYGQDKLDDSDHVGPRTSSVGRRMETGTPHTYSGEKPISESRGLRGKVVKTAKGGRQFVAEPFQKRPHPMPKGYKEGKYTPNVRAVEREFVSPENLAKMGWHQKNDGTWVKV